MAPLLTLLLIPLLVIPTDAFLRAPHTFASRLSVQAAAASEKEEHVLIDYCTGCRWMLRAAWMAQELLTTFQEELDSVTLIPSRPPAPGGVFVRYIVVLKVTLLAPSSCSDVCCHWHIFHWLDGPTE